MLSYFMIKVLQFLSDIFLFNLKCPNKLINHIKPDEIIPRISVFEFVARLRPNNNLL